MSEGRAYIRHPTDIPVVLRDESTPGVQQQNLRNISRGGVSCVSSRGYDSGSPIRVQIPLTHPPFETAGHVVWCYPKNGLYELGIKFASGIDIFRLRMIDQIFHILHYQKRVLETERRELSMEQASLEWIRKYASDFPE